MCVTITYTFVSILLLTFAIIICFGLGRTGTARGSIAPTCFLLAGKRAKFGYNTAYLQKGGAKKGSTIQMTEKAYMAKEAWLAMTPKLVEGYRIMLFIKDNPQWY